MTSPDEAVIMPPVIDTTDVAYAGSAPNRLAIAKTSSGPTTSRPSTPGNATMTTTRGPAASAEPMANMLDDDHSPSKDAALTDSATSYLSRPNRPIAARLCGCAGLWTA